MSRPFSQNDFLTSKYLSHTVYRDAAITLSKNQLYDVVDLGAAVAQTITIPANIELTLWPLGASCLIAASGAGGGQVTPGVGVTINGGAAPVAVSAAYGDYIMLVRDAVNEWVALKAVSSGGAADAFTVKTTVDDTTPSFLQSKLTFATGSGLSGAVQNPGANENLQLSQSGDGVIAINAQTGAAYQPVLGDANQIITMTNAGANTFTLPADATVAYPVGTRIGVAQLGAGQTTITPAGGVVISNLTGDFLMQRYQLMTLLKTAADTWVVSGGLFSTNDVHVYTANQMVQQVTLTDAANIAVNAALSNNFTVTLGGNRTLDNPSNLGAGMVLNFEIKQDGTGNRTLAFGNLYKFAGGVAPVASTAAAAIDFMSCYYDGAVLLCNYTKAYA